MICKICGKEYSKFGFPSHIKRTHKLDSKEYYDTYIGKPNICVCGKETPFLGLDQGYRKYCSQNCARRDALVKTREKYGVTNISQVAEVKAKMKQSIKDNWDNLTDEEYQNRCQAISKGTSKAMYKMHNRINEEVKDFCEKNQVIRLSELISKYGNGFMQTDLVKLTYIKYKHKVFVPISEIPIIEKYANMNVRSKHETYLYELVKLYYPLALQNTRLFLEGRELDIYIRSRKLAIEYNSAKYHCVEHDPNMKDLHLKKSIECREKGIRLIHIYDFEDYDTQVKLLIDLLEGKDNYPQNDFNKNNFGDIPEPEVIFSNGKYTVYGAGKLY